jgi:protoheme IX farnesyltransferase
MALLLAASASSQRIWLRQGKRCCQSQLAGGFKGSCRFLSSQDARRVTATAVPSQEQEEEEESLISTDVVKNSSKTKAYLELAKARLSALVVATTAAGFVAAGGPLSEQVGVATCCVVGTALCASSAAGWNQILEIDRDSKMKRTQQRPLVTGVLTKTEATIAATTWGVAGTSLLAVGTDPVTTALGVSNIVLYAGLYTYMKPISIYNTWVGAVVGAIPPVMGWTAATGGSFLDLDAIILGSTLYLWQMPHFFALSYMHRLDYKRGGFAMVPVLEENGDKTSNLIMRYAAYLSTVPIVSTLAGVTSSMFALEGIALNAYALYVANKFRKERTNANARKIFLTSLWYLPSFLVLFLLHSKVWDEEKDRDVLRDQLSGMIHKIRDQGRQVCIHEHVVTQKDPVEAQAACPVTVGRKGTAEIGQAVATATTTTTTLPQES